MRSQSPFAALAILAALSPLALANTWPQPQFAPIAIQSEATLAQHIGKKISVKGKLIRIHNSRVGINVNEKTDTQISIDPVRRPKFGELSLKFGVNKYRSGTKKIKYHYRGSEGWVGNNARRIKLDHLIKLCEFGESVELTGTLCHMTSTATGNVPKSIGYPQIPDSHFFFSVDDVTLVRN